MAFKSTKYVVLDGTCLFICLSLLSTSKRDDLTILCTNTYHAEYVNWYRQAEYRQTKANMTRSFTFKMLDCASKLKTSVYFTQRLYSDTSVNEDNSFRNLII